MKLLAVLFALLLLTGASLAPGGHANRKPPQTALARAKKSGPEMWKFGLVGLALAGFLIRKRI
jgi:hypothetical protein